MSDTMAKKKRKRKSIWSVVEGMKDRLAALIRESALIEKTEDEIMVILSDEFAEQIQEEGVRLTKLSLRRHIDILVWSRERLTSLEKLIRLGMDVDLFIQHHPNIPPVMIKKKARALKGVSRVTDVATFVPGINRLDPEGLAGGNEDYQLPITSFEEPFVAYEGELEDGFGVSTINGPSVGLAHSRVIEENPFRGALELAEKRNDRVLFITGGLFDLELKRAAGPLAVYRANSSGYNTNPLVIGEDYRPRVEMLLKKRPPGELIYETLAERFLNVLAGIRKICLKPNGKPEYTGKVVVQLGYKEEELINTAAYWELRFWTIVRNNQLGVELTIARQALGSALKELKEAVDSGDSDAILASLRARVAELGEEEKVILKEKQRTVISNISDGEKRRYARRTRAFVVRKIEEAIPNCTVIGMGSSYIKVGPTIWNLRQARNDRVAEGMLDSYVQNVAGSQVLSSRMAPMVLLASRLSPNSRMAVVERAIAGVRYDSQIFQLPIAVDIAFLHEHMGDSVRKAHVIQKLMSLDQTAAGTVRFVYVAGDWSPEYSFVGSQAAQIGRARHPRKNGPKESIIWIHVDTDQHMGHPWRMWVWDRLNERTLGMGRAVIEMMRRDGLFKRGVKIPIHMTTSLDDGAQGHNFESQRQPHPNILTVEDFQQALAEFVKSKDVEGMRELVVWQDLRRGEHWVQSQLDDYLEVELGNNFDFYDAILRRSLTSGVIIRGRSEITGDRSDRRDIGVVSFGAGNHLGNTVDKEISEGSIYAAYLRALFVGRTGWKDKKDLLRKMIRAPLYGNDHIGWGTIGVDGGYDWGVSLRSSPSRKNSHGDPLKRFIANILYRGNFSRIFEDKYTVHIVGDIHRYGTILAPQAAAISCASGTDTDPFGERGFTPNNTGILFVGLPAGGPDSGPIRVVTLRHERIRQYFESEDPAPFNWREFLPNAV